MKRSTVLAALVFGCLFALIQSNLLAVSQAGKAGLSSQQLAALQLASKNLVRGYQDLLSTAPDVKGDTSKLEGHMEAALNQLHMINPASIPAAPAKFQGQDRGKSREFILSAVKGHLDKAREVITSANVSSPYTKQALANIGMAEEELAAAGAAAQVK